jgi:hypothetical protein
MNHFFSVLILVLFFQTSSFACSCHGSSSVESSMEHSKYVIYGKMIDTSYVQVLETVDSTYRDTLETNSHEFLSYPIILKSRILVYKAYKGEFETDTLTIYTPAQSASCGYSFKPNTEYVIYGEAYSSAYDFIGSIAKIDLTGMEQAGTVWTNNCTRTTETASSEVSAIEEYLQE